MSRSQHSSCHSRSGATRRSGRTSESVVAGRIGYRAGIGRIVLLDGRAPISARGRNETRRPPYFYRWTEGWGLRPLLPRRWLADLLVACGLTPAWPMGWLLGRFLGIFRRRGRHLRWHLGARLNCLAALAAGQPNVINRMFDAVQARARGEHPTRKDPLVL